MNGQDMTWNVNLSEDRTMYISGLGSYPSIPRFSAGSLVETKGAIAMLKSHAEVDELQHDNQTGRWEPVKSLFEDAEPVFDLEPEILKKPGKWVKCGDTPFEVYRVDGEV